MPDTSFMPDDFQPEQTLPAQKPAEVDEFERTLVEHIFGLHEKFKRSPVREQKVKESKLNRRNYNQEIDQARQNFPWDSASCLNLPLVTIAVDNIEPRMVAALEGKGEEICHFQDIGEENRELYDIQRWFNKELIHFVKLRHILRSMVHNLNLDGTTYTLPYYDKKSEIHRDFVFVKQPVLDPQTGIPISEITHQPITSIDEPILMQETGEVQQDEEGNFVTYDYIDPIYEGVVVEVLPLEDIFCAADIEDWDEADIIREVNIPYGVLRQNYEDKVLGYQEIDDSLFRDALTGETISVDNQNPGETKHGRHLIPCLEAHITWDYQKAEDRAAGKWVGEEKIVALVTRTSRKLIRFCLQRELSFCNKKLIRRMRIFPNYGDTYGTATATKLKEIQNGANDVFNLVINSAYVCMIPWYFYTDASGLTQEIELSPGKGVKVMDAKAITFPRFNVNPAQFIEFINIFISLWERISSVSDVQVGRAPEITGNRAQTATSTMMQVQEANIKHSYTSRVLHEEFTSLLDFIYDLYYMNVPQEVILEQEGQMTTINKASLRKKRKFILTGTSDTANKYFERKESEDLYTMLSTNPIANMPKVLLDLLKTWDKENPEEYIDPMVNGLLQVYKADPQGLMSVVQQYVITMAEKEAEMKGGGAESGKKNAGTAARGGKAGTRPVSLS